MRDLKKAVSLFAVLLVVTSLLFLTGCGKTTSGKTTLRCAYWGDVKEIEIITASVERFKQQNPGIEVKLERLPAGDPYIEKILTQIAGGSAPDVMFVNAERYVVFAEKGILMPLNDMIAKSSFPLDGYYKKIVDQFSLDGSIYAIPRDIAPVGVVFYNKKLFDKAGLKYPSNDWDWARMTALAKKLTKGEGAERVFGFADDWPIWEAWVFSAGGKLVDKNENPTKCLLASKEALAGFQYRKDLIYKYNVMPSPQNMSAMGGVGAGDMFVQGKVAMFHSGIWKTPFFREITDFEWDAVMFPKGPAGKRGFLLSGAGYSVLKTTKHPEEAWKLLTFLSGEDGQKDLARTGLAQPAIMKIAESKEFLDGKAPKSKSFLLKAVDYGTFEPKYSGWVEAKSAYLWPAMDKLWADTGEAADVIPPAVAKINENFFKKK